MDHDDFLLAPARHAKRTVRSGAHPQNDFDLSKKRISSKSGFPPHRYYSRARLHQKSSKNHLGEKHKLRDNTDLTNKTVQTVSNSAENQRTPHVTTPSGQRPPEKKHGYETWNQRWTVTLCSRRQLDTQNERSDPTPRINDVETSKTIEISPKSNFPHTEITREHGYTRKLYESLEK